MVFPDDFESRLGFDQVRSKVSQYCLGEPGKKLTDGILFETSAQVIEMLLDRTEEARGILDRGEDFPIESYDDPSEWFETASVEGNFLEGEHFKKIAKTILVVQNSSTFLEKQKDKCRLLHKLAPVASTGKKLLTAIHQTIDEDGVVKDNASAELLRIRRRLRDEQTRVRRIAEQILRRARDSGWVAEGANATVRDGRLVIPMLAEHKRKLQGYIIDQSSTGQTVYIEPGEVMEANNDLRDLQLEERNEVIRILKELTGTLRLSLPELEVGYEFLSIIDFNRAKAKYALEIEAIRPTMKPGPFLDWKDSRHPILFLSLKGKRPLIPLTVGLTNEERFLLVSGPNAGGKSVCLKTVGLIQYMFQCGVLVPMRDDSTMGVFQKIFLDIGDQQSIENDLSTYSSHLRNMNFFIRNANEATMVLMDELGAGTDPNFGGGIAQAVLEQLVKQGSWGVATTHYYNLKVFASNFSGIRNAAMLFDTDKLIPLFRLEIGRPGSSFALEIARKTGLSQETLDDAERIIGKELTGLEKLIKEVAEEKLQLLEKDRDLRNREQHLDATLRKYEDLTGKLESQKKEILNRAKAEASTLLQETNREIEKTIRHIRENKAEKSETRKVRHGLKQMEKKVTPVQASTAAAPSESLKVGDKVRLIGGESSGTLLEIKGKSALVQFGELRSKVKADRLVKSSSISGGKTSAPIVRGVELHQRQSDFSPVLDVRGMRVEEVIPVITRFMDDAVLLSQGEVRILHGKGEGVLRKVIREYVKKLKSVSAFHDEHADRGGEGITIVKLK
jgi:DNA mismatch repair protein MutS2